MVTSGFRRYKSPSSGRNDVFLLMIKQVLQQCGSSSGKLHRTSRCSRQPSSRQAGNDGGRVAAAREQRSSESPARRRVNAFDDKDT